MANFNDLLPKQWVTAENIIQAYTSGGFSMRNPVSSSQQYVTRSQSESFLNIKPITGNSSAFVQKQELIISTPPPQIIGVPMADMNLYYDSIDLSYDFYQIVSYTSSVGVKRELNRAVLASSWQHLPNPQIESKPDNLNAYNTGIGSVVGLNAREDWRGTPAPTYRYNYGSNAILVKNIFLDNPSWTSFNFNMQASMPSETNPKTVLFKLGTSDWESKTFRYLYNITGTVYKIDANTMSIYYEVTAS